MKRRKLPIGIQNFHEIRADDHYYVDKTALALKLVDEAGNPVLIELEAAVNEDQYLWCNIYKAPTPIACSSTNGPCTICGGLGTALVQC